MHEIVLRKKGFEENRHFQGTANLGYLEVMENLNLFWVESNPISFLPIAIGLKRGFHGTANLGYLEALSAILRPEIEHLDFFWLESNPISFFVHCILTYSLTRHYCTNTDLWRWRVVCGVHPSSSVSVQVVHIHVVSGIHWNGGSRIWLRGGDKKTTVV